VVSNKVMPYLICLVCESHIGFLVKFIALVLWHIRGPYPVEVQNLVCTILGRELMHNNSQ